MAFYFALLNVSKKDNQEKSSHHRRHRRHSIASVESPLLDYRLLPRPQLLSDDLVITNELAEHLEEPTTSAPRRSRGSARASKWVHDNHSNQLSIPPQNPPSQPVNRNKRMGFGERGRRGRHVDDEEESGQGASGSGRSQGRMGNKTVQEDPQTTRGGSEGRKPKTTRKQRPQSHSEDDLEAILKKKDEEKEDEKKGKGMKKGGFRRGPLAPKKSIGDGKKTGNVQGTSSSRIPVSTTPTSKTIHNAIQSSFPLSMSISSSSSRHLSPPVVATTTTVIQVSNGRKSVVRSVVDFLAPPTNPLPEDRIPGQNPSIFHMMAGSATDESGRSSSQMSNESTTPRRDDSPASSCDSKEREVTMKLSAISMSSRSSEPRLKKVTFESAPYVISNSFLGDGAGSGVLVVRRNSGTAVRRMPWTAPTRVLLAPHAEVSGGDWWTRCDEEPAALAVTQTEDSQHRSDNLMNRQIEKSFGNRSILRRGLLRRRSTSDKSRLLAFRNSGFLSSSQERGPESTSKMTVSMDRPKFK